MEIQETKQPKSYAAVITYTIAVVFLLAGLFIPLTAGKEMLALCYPDIVKAMTKGSQSMYILAHQIDFLGMGKGIMDISSWIAFLYGIVVIVALVGFIPVAISTKKGTRLAGKFAYAVEVAAVLVLSIWLILELELLVGGKVMYGAGTGVKFSYSLLIAFLGTLITLCVFSCMNKKGTGAVKVILLLLSAVALLTLFYWTAMVPKLGKPLTKIGKALKVAPLFYGTVEEGIPGLTYVSALFETKFSSILKLVPSAKDKAAIVLALIVGLVIILNFLIDVISLSTNAKKTGHFFNVARYGLEIAAIVCLCITIAVCKLKVGLLLVIALLVVAIQLAISIVRLYRYIVANRTPEQIAEKEARKAERERAREERRAMAEAQAAAEEQAEETPEEQPVE